MEGLEDLCAALASNRTVTSLDLSYNDLRNSGASIVAEDLKPNAAMQLLDLSNNSLKGAFPQALGVRGKTTGIICTSRELPTSTDNGSLN